MAEGEALEKLPSWAWYAAGGVVVAGIAYLVIRARGAGTGVLATATPYSPQSSGSSGSGGNSGSGGGSVNTGTTADKITTPTLPQITLPKITMPTLPKITIPRITMPTITIPKITMPTITTSTAATLAGSSTGSGATSAISDIQSAVKTARPQYPNAIEPSPSQSVSAGQVLGLSGSTAKLIATGNTHHATNVPRSYVGSTTYTPATPLNYNGTPNGIYVHGSNGSGFYAPPGSSAHAALTGDITQYNADLSQSQQQSNLFEAALTKAAGGANVATPAEYQQALAAVGGVE